MILCTDTFGRFLFYFGSNWSGKWLNSLVLSWKCCATVTNKTPSLRTLYFWKTKWCKYLSIRCRIWKDWIVSIGLNYICDSLENVSREVLNDSVFESWSSSCMCFFSSALLFVVFVSCSYLCCNGNFCIFGWFVLTHANLIELHR